MRSNPYAPVSDVHIVMDSVRRAVLESAVGGRHPAHQVDRCVEQVVTGFWSTSRVKTFIPVLALRVVRTQLHAAPTAGDEPRAG